MAIAALLRPGPITAIIIRASNNEGIEKNKPNKCLIEALANPAFMATITPALIPNKPAIHTISNGKPKVKRAPCKMRESISRPKESVPNKNLKSPWLDHAGGNERASLNCSFAPKGAIKEPSKAINNRKQSVYKDARASGLA